MSDTPTAAVAEALKAHMWYFVGNLGVPGMPDSKDYKCSCGWTAGGGLGVGEDPHEHVAAAVLAALNLTDEWRVEMDLLPFGRIKCQPTPFPPRGELGDGDVVQRRLVGPWQEEQK